MRRCRGGRAMKGNSNKAHQEHAGGVGKTRGIVAGVLRDYKRAGEAEPGSIETGIAVVRARVAQRRNALAARWRQRDRREVVWRMRVRAHYRAIAPQRRRKG
ncbi:hypothetical protein E2542_SST00333 [Spatholobus suberectus]|nr:hypothetical protein E2542_SST00333 [Spatholobus suberectus]